MWLIEAIFRVIIFLLRPIYWLQYFLFGYGSIKKEIFQFLTHHYEHNFNKNDYRLQVSLFGGFSILNKSTNDVIVYSRNIKSDYIVIKNEGFKSSYFPTGLMSSLDKHFELEEHISLWQEKNKIISIEYTITIHPTGMIRTSIGRFEPIYTDIIIWMDGDYKITKIFKEVYDCMEMYTNRISFDEYSINYSINDFFHSIIIEKLSENPQIVEIVPELVVPSAYDFNSDDFKGRLLISEMITC